MSDLWKIDWKDLINGLFFAVIGVVLDTLYQFVSAWSFNWLQFWQVFFGAALAYLIKRFVSNAKGTPLTK